MLKNIIDSKVKTLIGKEFDQCVTPLQVGKALVDKLNTKFKFKTWEIWNEFSNEYTGPQFGYERTINRRLCTITFNNNGHTIELATLKFYCRKAGTYYIEGCPHEFTRWLITKIDVDIKHDDLQEIVKNNTEGVTCMNTTIKEKIYNWLDERFDAYVGLGCDEGAEDPKDYARDEMDFYSDNPADIVNDYIDEVIEAFNGNKFFVLNNRAEIDQATVDWYKEYGYINTTL